MAHRFEKEKLKIKKQDDKRIKLTEEDKKDIRKQYSTGFFSQRQLAKMFNVSRRTIQFIINPDAYKRNAEIRKQNGKDGRYYDKEKHSEEMKKYRQRKLELYKEGKLI